jgi:hypothetical protein
MVSAARKELETLERYCTHIGCQKLHACRRRTAARRIAEPHSDYTCGPDRTESVIEQKRLHQASCLWKHMEHHASAIKHKLKRLNEND